ncbi:MAG: tetratricopeptide repeat protein [Thermodesulfobacteriota bacterium]
MRRKLRWVFGTACTIWILTGVPLSAQEDLPALIKRIEPSIVAVITYTHQGNRLGQGTGFFVDPEGDVITNRHVLEGASQVEIRTTSGQTYRVKGILADDKEGDLVRLTTDLQGKKTRPVPLSASIPEVGERVFVIGSPLGLAETVSDGIISAVREIPQFGKIIQLTAPISPGSSGSPVMNMKGELIGVATFFVMTGQNLNFAIPAERIRKMVPDKARTIAEWGDRRKEELRSEAGEVYLLGLRHLWIEDYGQALALFEETVRRNPDHADAHFQRGYCFTKLGRYKEAIDAYQESIRLKPEDSVTLNNLCVAYNRAEHYEEALATCLRAILLKSDLVEAYNNLGWTFHKLGRYQEAIEVCRRAIQLKPDFSLAYFNLGNNYSATRSYREAVEAYKQGIRIAPDHADSHLNLGASYFEMGQYENAREAYQQAIRLKPDSIVAHLNLGMVYLRVGDKGSALEEFKILKKLDPESANRLFTLIYE